MLLLQCTLLVTLIARLGSALTISARTKRDGGFEKILDDALAEEYFFYINDDLYLAPTAEQASYDRFSFIKFLAPSPVTVVSLSEPKASVADISGMLQSYAASDDVLTSSFFGILFVTASTTTAVSGESWSVLAELGVKTIFFSEGITSTVPEGGIDLQFKSSFNPGAQGPFLAITKDESTSLFPVYRLEPDVHRDFVVGAYPAARSTGGFIPFNRVTTELGDLWIPIPSKLSTPSSRGPLAGKRFGVKDLYDVQGLVTTGGSRAYAEIYGTANVTASSVQRLLDLGAVLVGKTKTGQFASGADTNDATLDYQYPFSPRADGWQTCGASSSGSGCAIAAYDWLDFTIGTDTGGSVRLPAAVSGVYGMRPTVGAIELDHVQPLTPLMDTGGMLARNPEDWADDTKAWYGESPLKLQSYPSFPKRIIIPTNYYPWGSPAGIALGETFIQKMMDHFGMEKVEIDLNDAMIEGGHSPNDIRQAIIDGNGWYQWEYVGKPLVDAWGAKYEGRFPPVDTARRTAFLNARANLTEFHYNNSTNTILAFREWFNQDLLPFNAETCSESIIIYDVGAAGLPAYREAGLFRPNVSTTSFSNVHTGEIIQKAGWTPAGGAPDITIPIGQIPFNSSLTLIEEQHPVSLNIAARQGCDFMLLDMVKSMAQAGLLKTVQTGRNAF